MRAIKFHLPHVEKKQRPKSKGQSSIQSLSHDSIHPTIDLAASSGDCRLRHSLPPVKPQVLNIICILTVFDKMCF